MEYEGDHVILKNPSWWERRTNLERRAMALSFVLFLLVIGLIIGLAVILFNGFDREMQELYSSPFDEDYPVMMPIREQKEPICVEPGCIHAASDLLKYVDLSFKPCEDFYHFACGGFLNETHIPTDLIAVNSYTYNFDLLQQQLRTVVEEPAKPAEIKPFVLLKKLYTKCMDTGAVELDGVATLRSALRNLGGWPLLDGYEWNEQHFDWQNTVYRFRRAGFSPNYFLSLKVSPDFYNSSRYYLELDEADLGPELDFLARGLEDENVKAYFSYMVEVATRLGAEMPFGLTQLKAVLEFEVALAKISVNKDDIWNMTTQFHPMRISELQRKHNSIIWVDYINRVIDLPEYKVTSDEKIIVRVPQYLTDFENLLRWTSKRVLANYIMWRAVKFSVDFLPAHFRDLRNNFYRSVYDINEMPARWEECVLVVSTRMPFVMGSLYVQKYINEDDKEVVYEMVANIRNQFIELIKAIDWMDDSTRLAAFDKIESMAVYTAFSDELLSTKRLQKHYSQLDFNRNSYINCILSVDLFEKDKYYKRLRSYAGTPDWNVEEYMIEVSPNYFPLENKLSIPNAILQGIFFSTKRPQYLNYGALGYRIAHEIADGLDDTGVLYGTNTVLAHWWSDHTKRAFMRKTQCMSSQFRNYTHNVAEVDIFMHGINKNVANQGGLKAAYYAYLKWIERYGREFQLPSLTYYTPQQLFWIAAAQTHCTKYRTDYLKREGFTEYKSPAYFDVHETFSNVEYFARDFHCRYGSALNPVHKCLIW